MKKLFEKNEIGFAILLIVVYVIGSGIVQGVSESIGIAYLGEMVFHAAMALVLLVFIKRSRLMQYLGICPPAVPAANMWFYIPMLAAAALPICFGIGTEYSAAALTCRTVSMLCVGFLEEIIFRGFLFRGIYRRNVSRAIVISAVTFGIGHIVNLANGYEIFDSVVQIVYAVCVGFMLVYVFYRTGSLLPCIAFHSLNNCLTGFTSAAFLVNAADSERAADMILLAVRLAIMLVYTGYIVKKLPQRTLPEVTVQ